MDDSQNMAAREQASAEVSLLGLIRMSDGDDRWKNDASTTKPNV